MQRGETAVDRAMRYVEAGIRGGAWARGDRLPSIAALARAAGVSPVSMWRAVGSLRSRNILIVKHGSGATVASDDGAGPDDSREPVVPPREQSWVRARTRILHDIANGTFAPGASLPSVKELSVRYGVCYRTLVQALRALNDSADLQRVRGRHAVPAPVAPSRGGSIVLIGSGDARDSISIDTKFQLEFVRCLENRCNQLNTRLRLLACVERKGRTVYVDGTGTRMANLRPREPTLGYIVWNAGLAPHIDTIPRHLDATGLPVCVVASNQAGMRLPLGLGQRPVRVYAIGLTTLAGQQVGRFLLHSGHRSVAYLSPFHRSRWSVRRLEGLRDVLDGRAAVTPFTLGAYRWVEDVLTDSPEARRYRKLRSALAAADDREAPHGTEELSQHLELVMGTRGLARMIAPLFDRALDDRHVSAWVCANDEVAILALAYLYRQGRRVPKDLSVVGFDDTFDSVRHNLTTYNFNMSALADATIDELLSPRKRPADETPPVREIEGYMAVRGTTAVIRPGRQTSILGTPYQGATHGFHTRPRRQGA